VDEIGSGSPPMTDSRISDVKLMDSDTVVLGYRLLITHFFVIIIFFFFTI
jgi:hypothetical protein